MKIIAELVIWFVQVGVVEASYPLMKRLLQATAGAFIVGWLQYQPWFRSRNTLLGYLAIAATFCLTFLIDRTAAGLLGVAIVVTNGLWQRRSEDEP